MGKQEVKLRPCTMGRPRCRSSCSLSAIAKDAVRISGCPVVSAMQFEMFRVTCTNMWLGAVGIDPEIRRSIGPKAATQRNAAVESCFSKDTLEENS